MARSGSGLRCCLRRRRRPASVRFARSAPVLALIGRFIASVYAAVSADLAASASASPRWITPGAFTCPFGSPVKPGAVLPGCTPRLRFMVVGPVFVTVAPPRTLYSPAVPRLTVGTIAAFAVPPERATAAVERVHASRAAPKRRAVAPWMVIRFSSLRTWRASPSSTAAAGGIGPCTHDPLTRSAWKHPTHGLGRASTKKASNEGGMSAPVPPCRHVGAE